MELYDRYSDEINTEEKEEILDRFVKKQNS